MGLIGVAEAFDQSNIETLTLNDLGLNADQVGLEGSPTRVVKMRTTKRSRACEMLSGEPEEQVTALVRRLNQNGVLR